MRPVLSACFALVLAACATPLDNMPPHHSPSGFRNPHNADPHGGRELLKFLWRWYTEPWTPVDFPLRRPDSAALRAPDAQQLTWIGHSTFLIQSPGLNVLTDPHLSQRASPVGFAGPQRLVPPALDFAGLPPIHAVLISHDHYDHLDLPTVRRLAAEHAPQFFVPLGLKALLEREGIGRVTELDWWQSATGTDYTVTAVPVQHFSGRGAFDRNRSLWAGFVLEVQGRRVFFAGDTGYSPDFAEIGRRFAPLDLSLIPIGAYDPRSFMQPMHVNPEEAVQIHRDLGSRQSYAMHWGTFRLTLEPLDEPPRRLRAALDAAGLAPEAFQVLQHGQTRPW
ncbi:MAG: MBL fold metallo-hydrolase [Gammaproteobacteria bacterium]